MSTIKRFEEIEAWQTARELCRMIYTLSNQGMFARDYGLRDQMCRSAISVLSNIAEGFESHTQSLFINFLGRAKASAGEFRAQLYIALDQQYITQQQFDQAFELADKSSRQIFRLVKYLESKPNERRVREERVEHNI